MNRHHNQHGSGRGLRYTLPTAAGTVWLGLGWISIAGLAGTVTAVVLLLMQGVPLPAVVPLAAGGAAVSAVPVAGRPALAWIPTLAAHHLARLTHAHSWSRNLEHLQAGDPTVNTTSQSVADPGSGSRLIRMPVGIGPRCLDLLVPALPSSTGAAGIAPLPHVTAIAHGRARRGNRRGGRMTVVFDLVALGRFGVLDPSEQDTELARWGSSLAVLCADPRVHSVQWLTHARPDTRNHTLTGPRASGLDGALSSDLTVDLTSGASGMRQDYTALADAITRQATRHRHLLALTIDTAGHTHGTGTRERMSERTQRKSELDPVENDNVQLLELLAAMARDTVTALLASDLLARPLTCPELGTVLRLLLDPTLIEAVEAGEACSGGGPSSSEPESLQDRRQWLPVSARGGWDSCRTDDTFHRCFAITGWPRLSLPGDWLAPLLHDTPPIGTSRTLTVHARPVRPEHAARRARAASAKAHLDASDRSRLGFTPHPGGSAHDSLAEADAAATEAELVAGYRMTDTSALLTISALDLYQLETACRQLRAIAVAHRLDVRPLHGQHLTALAAALPLGLRAGATT